MARGNQKIKSQEENKKRMAAMVCCYSDGRKYADAGIDMLTVFATIEIGKFEVRIRDATR
jgi:uncharacterized protein YjhX (UPF0386 family)